MSAATRAVPAGQDVQAGFLAGWVRACRVEDILPGTGVCALIAGQQVALFRVPPPAAEAGTGDEAGEQFFALGNHDPAGGANVLSRGLVGDLRGEPVVASPLYKHHYSLRTGRCQEDDSLAIPVWSVRIVDGQAWVRTPAAS